MALEKILHEKRKEVALSKQSEPLDSFAESLEPARRSLLRSLSQSDSTRFVLECKKASPSRGILRANYDPVALAQAYDGIADGISVLTDTPFFHGSLLDLQRVSAAVKIPVLRKDFIIDPYQIYEARRYGADAVLLMLSVITSDDLFRECFAAVKQLGMDALVEVHDRDELDRALELNVPLIGINNRNLKTLTLDLSTTENLASLVPADRVLLSESGILSHKDVLRLRSLVNGFLIGSSLVTQPDVRQAAQEIVTGRVKVCGLRRPHDVRAAHAAGATFGGFIFAPESPRCVSVDEADFLRKEAALKFVGVFVNAGTAEVINAVQRLSLAAVQLHGEETPEEVGRLRVLLPDDVEIWKAVRVQEDASEYSLPRAADFGADRLLLDASSGFMRGGTGRTFDWKILKHLTPAQRSDMILAGGLNPKNAEHADALGMYALDVNSGVEVSVGEKNENLLHNFFSALRGAGRNRGTELNGVQR